MSIKIITNIDLNKSSFLEKLTYKLSNNLIDIRSTYNSSKNINFENKFKNVKLKNIYKIENFEKYKIFIASKKTPKNVIKCI